MKNDLKNKIAVVIGIIIVVLLTFFYLNKASFLRGMKSISSEINNGMDRTITVYDYNGNEIKHWTGKFDVTFGETGVMFDDPDGKRVIITNGIVINEEN